MKRGVTQLADCTEHCEKNTYLILSTGNDTSMDGTDFTAVNKKIIGDQRWAKSSYVDDFKIKIKSPK